MPPSTRLRRVRRRHSAVIAALIVVGTAITMFAPVVGAAPLDDKQTQAAQLQDQIEASDLEIGALGEKLHDAEARRDAAQATVLDAEARIEESKQEVARIKRLIEQNAASLYRRNSEGTAGIFDFDDANKLLRRAQYAKVQASRDDKLLQSLARAQEELSIRRDDATRARDEAAAERDQINATKAEYEGARAAQQALLDQVKGEIEAEIAAERARREAAARAKYAVASPASYPNVGPPNGSAAQAIAFARGVIGSGYSKNPRMGPTYDCSGLTYMAWRAAGVNIPTISNTQYDGLPHVPLNAIQPGDLIFYGPGGNAHVALYVGGGMIIDASGSQDAVVERALWGDPIGAARVV